MLKKYCKCGKLISQTDVLCSNCIRNFNRDYDKYRRKNTDFYHSKEWKALREVVRNKFNFIDAYVYVTEGRIVRGMYVHHIEPLEDNKGRGLDISNLICVGRSHERIHSIYNKSDKDKKNLQDLLFKIVREWI